MRGLGLSEDHPNFGQVDLDDVRKLEMSYSQASPDKIHLSVEYKASDMRSYLKGFREAIYRKLGFRQKFLAANSVNRGNESF